MIDIFATLLPYKVLAGHVVFALLVVAIIFRKSWGREVSVFVGRYALTLAFLVALGAIVGSIFYSDVIGYEPCVLCWWQRAALYPSALILGIAAWKKDRSAFVYVVPLAVFAALVAAYQYYSTSLGGGSFLACTDDGGACSRIYVKAFGYITIELMSLTVSAFILLFAWANRIYKNENSDA